MASQPMTNQLHCDMQVVSNFSDVCNSTTTLWTSNVYVWPILSFIQFLLSWTISRRCSSTPTVWLYLLVSLAVLTTTWMFLPPHQALTLIATSIFTCFISIHFSKDRGKVSVNAKDEASFLNDLYLNQALGLVKIGIRRVLLENDVPELSSWEKCCQIYQPFEVQWKKENEHWKTEITSFKDKKLSTEKKPNLLLVLMKTFGFKYFTLQVGTLIIENMLSDYSDLTLCIRLAALCAISQASTMAHSAAKHTQRVLLCILELTWLLNPLMMESLMAHVGNVDSPASEGYCTVMAMAVIYAIFLVLYNRVYFEICRMSHHICVTIRLAVFNKALTMTNESGTQKTSGKLISLITEDCEKITYSSIYSFHLLSTPFKVILSMYLLYRELGNCTFFGLIIMLAVIPINLWASKKLLSHQENKDKIKDERIKVLNEILNGIKVLKLYAWEKAFIDKISSIRNTEVDAMQGSKLFSVLLEITYRAFPFTVQVLCFSVFIFSGGHLTPTTAFVSASLFGILYSSCSVLSYVVPNFLQAAVSFKKINEFLHLEDIPEDIVQKEDSSVSNVAIEIVDGTFTWQKTAPKNTLTEINIKIHEGELVAVVGMVGAGKSSLLSAILGEMHKLNGSVLVKGRTAYVAQEAWIQSITLKENIIFGSAFEEKKYQKIIQACALSEDLKMLSEADNTKIGERGINLSGGQKQRVNLARSVYSDADIYLLDDPLSAVDSHVGKHIFDQVIGPEGLLKNKTRLLVTHGAHWLPFFDNILVLKDSIISEVGSYKELLKNNGDFAQFLNATKTANGKYNNHYALDRPITSQYRDVHVFKKSLVAENIDKDEYHNTIDSIGNRGEINKNLDNEDEQTETENISSKVYIEFLKAIGLKSCLLVSIVFVLWLIFKDVKELWLGRWTEDLIIKNKTLQSTTVYTSTTVYYLTTYVMIGGFGIVLSSLFLYLVQTKALDAANRLHLKLLFNILRAPMSFFDTTPTGRIISRFSKDISSVDGLGDCLEEYLRCSGAVVMQLCVILFLNLQVSPFIVLVTCLFLYLRYLFSKTARQLRRYRDKYASPIIDFFKETIHGLSTIRAFGAQKRFVSEMHSTIENHFRFDLWEMFVGIWFDTQIAVLSCVVILASGVVVIWSGSISPAQAGLIFMYSLEFVNSLGWFMTHSTYTEQELVSLERVLDYSSKPAEAEWEIPETKPDHLWPQDGEVKFENYKARYRDGLELVLRGVSCHIKKGEKVGIVGRTGAGKSSLMNALFRLMEASEGQILLDNCIISTLGLHDLRKKVTILPQDPVIFGGSIRTNLDPLGEKTTEELWEALKHSHLKVFVKSLPGNLDYSCGEGGKNFSVGQRQLVCLARALLHKTKVLVLDEATASVDLETDDLIQKTICTEFKDCTVLTIAHRINTILDYDRILVIDNGLVKEFDTPQNLLRNKTSSFYRLAKDAGLIT